MQFSFTKTQLKNGVRVLLLPMVGNDSVTTLVLARTGSRNESVTQAGISHILEHMVLKATKKYPTHHLLSSTIDSMGANHNAFTGKEYTGYYISASTRHLEKSLDILADVVTHPLLEENSLKTEKGVIVEEYNMYQDLPMRRSIEEFENLLFEGCSLGRFIEGTPNTINATTALDLRNYLNQWYQGGNILVVIAGKIDDEVALNKSIESHFGSLKTSSLLPFNQPPQLGANLNRHIPKKTEQAHFVIGVPGLDMTDPRRYALQLAGVVLGGPMSSRLFNEIREKRGLAYYVHADVETAFDNGYFSVRAGVKLDKLAEAVNVVRDQLLQLADTFTEAELTLGKDYLLGRLPLELESSMDVAQYLGITALLTDNIVTPQEVEKSISSLTLADIKSVLQELIKPELFRTVIVGPDSLS